MGMHTRKVSKPVFIQLRKSEESRQVHQHNQEYSEPPLTKNDNFTSHSVRGAESNGEGPRCMQ